MKKIFLHLSLACSSTVLVASGNLLLNSDFHFSSFDASRIGEAQTYRTGSVPFWDQEAYGDSQVYRAPRNPIARPTVSVDGAVVLHPGKTLSQFRLLSDLHLDDGDEVVLAVKGHQSADSAVRAAIFQMKLDSQEGTWKPSDFQQNDPRTFPRAARGEMIPVEIASAVSSGAGDFDLVLPKAKIAAPFGGKNDKADSKTNTIGIKVSFTNQSQQDVLIYAPSLSRAGALDVGPADGEMSDAYRHLPRTISKLRQGLPLHVVVMGSSIDRGSANPPMYLYDEDPKSAGFKQPISSSDLLFDGGLVGHPEWTPYFGQWRHYLSYAGRLKRALMRRFDYPADKLLFNYMACDGSSIGESHSALSDWVSLRLPPDPEINGQQKGKSWQELYKDVLARPEGPRPDLVIFGSGANEKIDGPDEVAAFEGAIRWFQRNYPGVEFVFCMWQNREDSPNASMLKELSLRYGIPCIDFGRTANLSTRHVQPHTLIPSDGHPQAAAHDLWARSLEVAFQPSDPIGAGFPQQHLPDRVSSYTIGWEGEVSTYKAGSPRIRKERGFLLDDSVVNLWASSTGEKVGVFVDGAASTDPHFSNGSRLKPFTYRDPRNSTFAIGRLSLGDRHILEVDGDAKIVAVDAKSVLNRNFTGVEQGWDLPGGVSPFASEWGAPYGAFKATMGAGQKAILRWVGTDCSVAWSSQENGGTLIARVDGVERLRKDTGEKTKLSSGETVHMENRAGIQNLPYGVHELEIEAMDGNVDLLGAFSYDTRPNESTIRRKQGLARPGETIVFSPPFRAVPIVIPSSGLKVENVSASEVKFSGQGEAGSYQIVGE